MTELVALSKCKG